MRKNNAWRPGPGVDENGCKVLRCIGPDCERKLKSTGTDNRLCAQCRLIVGSISDMIELAMRQP